MANDLTAEIAAFEARRNELEQQHFGKYVVFYHGEYIGSFDSFDNAAREAVSRFGVGPYLIRRVGDTNSMPMPASVAYRIVGAAG